MTLLHDRSKSIDVQIRKHQTRLHNIEVKRLQHGADEKALEQLVRLSQKSIFTMHCLDTNNILGI